ncbi:unnamed protein product [Adineta ricciae]|uniref:Uncharacterized protein n=2 Tax=Adineta ricciae TaxID=249248 RepID=A0A815M878_ADIRI|nr:unnamed protein product [Adineta ricciae]
MIRLLTILLILIDSNVISTKNDRLNSLEENLLYSHLKDSTNLKLFYEKLIQSDEHDKQQNQNQANDSNQCFSSSNEILNKFHLNENSSLSKEDLQRLTPILATMKLNPSCHKIRESSKWKHFLFGLISVTLINLTALFGAIILPFRKKPIFKWILSSFIGLAVGTLLGTGIFHLIPMGFDVESYDKESTFINKGLVGLIIIYLFFMRDQLSTIFFHIQTTIPTHDHVDEDISPILHQKNTKSLKENLQQMKPIGWMILIGDTLHGFIDGLTIGAIAMVSISNCLRMTISIVCEEFSHKLGDTAILLSSGLPIKQALLMNFISACGIYPGFFIGAKLGELENFHPWICALAGGMFVYIGLADMIPELISMGEEIEKDTLKENKPISRILKTKILLTQNLGVITGVASMYLSAKYGDFLESYF